MTLDVANARFDELMTRFSLALAVGFGAGGIGGLVVTEGLDELTPSILWFALASAVGVWGGMSASARWGGKLPRSRPLWSGAVVGVCFGTLFSASLWVWAHSTMTWGSSVISESVGFGVLGAWNGLLLGLAFVHRFSSKNHPSTRED